MGIWATVRMACMNVFAVEHNRWLTRLMFKSAEDLADAASSAARSGMPLDLEVPLSNYSMRVLFNITFGVDLPKEVCHTCAPLQLVS